MERPNNSLNDFLCAEGFKSTKGREIILKELKTRGIGGIGDSAMANKS
jgi:hypothetical protein